MSQTDERALVTEVLDWAGLCRKHSADDLTRSHAALVTKTAARTGFEVWAGRLAKAEPWSHRPLRRAMMQLIHEEPTAIDGLTLGEAETIIREKAAEHTRFRPTVEPSRWNPRVAALIRLSVYNDPFFSGYPRVSAPRPEPIRVDDDGDPGPERERPAEREPQRPRVPRPAPGIRGRVVA